MKSSKIRIMSACAAIAVLCAMLASCADHSKTGKVKDSVNTKPSASTTAADTTAEDTTAAVPPTEEEILSKTDENGIAVIGTTAYITHITPANDLSYYAEIMQNNYGKYSNVDKIAANDAVLNVQFKNSGTTFEGDPLILLFIKSVSARGNEKVFDEPEQMYGNWGVGLIKTEDAVIFEKSTYGAGIKLIFTQYGMEEIDDSFEALRDDEKAYKHPITSFKLREDGKIGYTVMPQKYTAIQDVAGFFAYCVSRGELYQVNGYVSFENGKTEYHPEERITVSENSDLDSAFQHYMEQNSEYFKDINVETLDDFLKYNSERYEEFEY